MGNCNSCIFYDEKYDSIRQSGQDVVRIGEQEKDTHFCPLYPQGIPEKVWSKMKDCPNKMKL